MDLEKLRWYQLKKQHLLPLANDYLSVLGENTVLHATDGLTPYFSLWARVNVFEPQQLFEDLNRTRQAVRVRAFRGTLFVAQRRLLPEILAAAKIYFESQLSLVQKVAAKQNIDLAAQTERLRQLLAGKKNLTSREIKKAFQDFIPDEHFILLMRYWEFSRDLGRAPLRYLQDNIIRYGLMPDLVPEYLPRNGAPEEALEKLFLKYLHHFGPVCLADICWWFPLKKNLARQLLNRTAPGWVQVTLNHETYFMEKNDFAAFTAFEFTHSTAAVIHFLPYEDHFPKAYFVRDWFLAETVKELVYEKGTINRGQIRPTIWVNGEIVGRWEIVWNDAGKSVARIQIKGIIGGHTASTPIEIERKRLEDFINTKLVPLMKNMPTCSK